MSKPTETRGQFVAGYIERSKLKGARQTRAGFEHDGYRFTATRCNCGEPECLGWSMDAGRQITEVVAA